MITHLTASSSKFLSASPPYINSAIYLIGPTSDSNFITSPLSGSISKMYESILLFALIIFFSTFAICTSILSNDLSFLLLISSILFCAFSICSNNIARSGACFSLRANPCFTLPVPPQPLLLDVNASTSLSSTSRRAYASSIFFCSMAMSLSNLLLLF